MAADDLRPYVRGAEAVVYVDKLKLDLRVEHGQERGLNTKEVERHTTSRQYSPPMARMHLTLRDYELDESGNGMYSDHSPCTCIVSCTPIMRVRAILVSFSLMAFPKNARSRIILRPSSSCGLDLSSVHIG